ncbi:ThiS family protein [Polystyrenella longa]|uniref:ThiS family protein n=1 Tax=Polystyrenella longa TaxID=2528007 RepID=A0A518CKG5_9PLAN|nr:MoaD/ThiS family protein [Polystyrenella longa]QDU79720.1 ThiS family protein [Polystyrenella longa]
MPRVFIPPHVRRLVDGQKQIEVEGSTVEKLVSNLDAQYPGVREVLCLDGALKPGLAVAVDGSMSNRGLHQSVKQESEVHFLPAVGGG